MRVDVRALRVVVEGDAAPVADPLDPVRHAARKARIAVRGAREPRRAAPRTPSRRARSRRCGRPGGRSRRRGQTAGLVPPRRSVTQPSRTHAPSTTGSRRLNQRRRARDARGQRGGAGVVGVQRRPSPRAWRRKIRAFALPRTRPGSRADRGGPGVTFSTAATCGRKASVVSSWKLETSATTQPSAGNRSASAASGRPMFPPTNAPAGRTPRRARRSAPSSWSSRWSP